MRFLIDECLSPQLARSARDTGHEESMGVYFLGLRGAKDSAIADRACADGWILVTRNSRDFRGPDRAPGRRGHYANRVGHPGLVCLNADGAFRRDQQVHLFLAVLLNLPQSGAMSGLVIEVELSRHGLVEVVSYRMP